MIEIGSRCDFVNEIPGTMVSRRSSWQILNVLEFSECEKYVKVYARPSWGKPRIMWVARKELPEKDFYKPED